MNRIGFRFTSSLVVLATLLPATLAISACSAGGESVGSTQQELKKRKDGGPTGNGRTCSWDDTVVYNAATGKATTKPAPNGPYGIGDAFPSPDGCNDCSCTAQGIACTLRACAPGGSDGTPPGPGGTLPEPPPGGSDGTPPGGPGDTVPEPPPGSQTPPGPGCTDDAKLCPDGRYVGRTGPRCEFVCGPVVQPPGGGTACSQEAKRCPDGTYVGRTGPKCEFVCR